MSKFDIGDEVVVPGYKIEGVVVKNRGGRVAPYVIRVTKTWTNNYSSREHVCVSGRDAHLATPRRINVEEVKEAIETQKLIDKLDSDVIQRLAEFSKDNSRKKPYEKLEARVAELEANVKQMVSILENIVEKLL